LHRLIFFLIDMLKCPNCQSEDTIKVSQLYSKSTKSVNTTSTGGGVGLGTGGISVGGAVSTTGTIQTLEGTKLSPPKSPSNFKIGCVAFIAYVVVYFLTINELIIWIFGANSVVHEYGSYIFMILGIIMASKWASRRTEKEMSSYQSKLSQWEGSWTCNRCGDVFHPPTT